MHFHLVTDILNNSKIADHKNLQMVCTTFRLPK